MCPALNYWEHFLGSSVYQCSWRTFRKKANPRKKCWIIGLSSRSWAHKRQARHKRYVQISAKAPCLDRIYRGSWSLGKFQWKVLTSGTSSKWKKWCWNSQWLESLFWKPFRNLYLQEVCGCTLISKWKYIFMTRVSSSWSTGYPATWVYIHIRF